jgi:hypothetical protein
MGYVALFTTLHLSFSACSYRSTTIQFRVVGFSVAFILDFTHLPMPTRAPESVHYRRGQLYTYLSPNEQTHNEIIGMAFGVVPAFKFSSLQSAQVSSLHLALMRVVN